MNSGSKSGFAVSESFYYICRKDGVEIKFLLYQGEQFTEYQKIVENSTEEPNGVEVVVPIKNRDLYFEFQSKAVEKLAYYDTAILIIEDKVQENKIYRNNLFQWSSTNTNPYLHFALKDVYYEIDFSKLGITNINLPVCIRFGLEDGLMPTPSREGIIYTPDTIALFKNKIKEVANWFISRHNESVKEIDLKELPKKFESLNPYGKRVLDVEGKQFDITGLSKYSDVQFTYAKIKDIKHLSAARIYSVRDIIMKGWQLAGKGSRGSLTISKNYSYANPQSLISDINDRTFSCNNLPSGIWRQYLEQEILISIPKYSFIRKGAFSPTLDWYKLNLYFKTDKIDRVNWRAAINEFLAIRKAFEDSMEPVENYTISEAWNNARKAHLKSQRNTGPINRNYVKKEEINLRPVVKGVNVNFILGAGEIVAVDDLNKTEVRIYGLPEERYKIGKLTTLGIPAYCMAERDINRLLAANLSNWITYEEYLKGNTEHFKQYFLKIKKFEYTKKIEAKYNAVSFLMQIDPWIKSEFSWFQNGINRDTVMFAFIQELYDTAKKKNWWYDSEADIRWSIFDQVLQNKDLSFLQYITTNKHEGMELAKEIYFSRMEKEKQKQ